MSLNVKILITAAVVGFGIVHVVGMMLQHVSARSPIENTGPMHHGD
jgi:hypothetical protein